MTFRYDVSQSLDAIGEKPFSVLYRAEDIWNPLTPGPEGHVLTSGGDSAPPHWAPGGGGGGGGNWTPPDIQDWNVVVDQLNATFVTATGGGWIVANDGSSLRRTWCAERQRDLSGEGVIVGLDLNACDGMNTRYGFFASVDGVNHAAGGYLYSGSSDSDWMRLYLATLSDARDIHTRTTTAGRYRKQTRHFMGLRIDDDDIVLTYGADPKLMLELDRFPLTAFSGTPNTVNLQIHTDNGTAGPRWMHCFHEG